MSPATLAARRVIRLVALGTAHLGRLAHRARYGVRYARPWVAWSSVTWLGLRLAGLPADMATALVGGVVLVAAVLVFWVLVVEPRLFAPRPSIRPRVLPGPAHRPVLDEADELVHVASYVTSTGQVVDVEARPDRGGAR